MALHMQLLTYELVAEVQTCEPLLRQVTTNKDDGMSQTRLASALAKVFARVGSCGTAGYRISKRVLRSSGFCSRLVHHIDLGEPSETRAI